MSVGLRTPLREHRAALARYRAQQRAHAWACVGLEALLATATQPIGSARRCGACRGLGLGTVMPLSRCGVCGGTGYVLRTRAAA